MRSRLQSVMRPIGVLRRTEPLFPLSPLSRDVLRRTSCAAPLTSSTFSSASSSLRYPSLASRRYLHASTTTRQEASPAESSPAYIVPDSFAVVYVGGRQYKVTKGDLIITERLLADVGEKIHLKKVLLVGSQNFTAIGTPLLTEAIVEASVEEQTRAAKVIVFKFKRRKNHRRTRGHRQYITVLRIGDIKLSYPQVAPEANSDRSAIFGPVVPTTRLLPPSETTEPKESTLS